MNAFPTQQIVHSIVPIDEDNVAVTFQFRKKQVESKAFDPRHVRFTMDLSSDRAMELAKEIRKFNRKRKSGMTMIRVRPSCMGSIEMLAEERIPTFHFSTGANQPLRITFPDPI